MSKVDQNSRYVALAETPTGTITSLKVDSVTGYLLVSIEGMGAIGGTDAPTVDQNSRDTATAEDPSGNIVILQTNNSGVLYAAS